MMKTKLSVASILLSGGLFAALVVPVTGCSMTEAVEVASFLPPPPSEAWRLAADEKARLEGIKLRKADQGRRGEMAAADAMKISTKWAENMLSPVVGFTISKEGTPALHKLVSLSLKTAKETGRAAKGRYLGRERPFVVHPEDLTCNREVRDELNPNSSYPSGHTTAIWTVGLALSAVIPEKAGEILDRAYQAGENRWICGHHWKSDVEAGRALAAATYASLTADPDYLKLLEKARTEARQQK